MLKLDSYKLDVPVPIYEGKIKYMQSKGHISNARK